MKELINEWETCNKIKMFEIDVIDIRTGESEVLDFDIDIEEDNRQLIAGHVPMNEKQRKSDKASYVAVTIEEGRTLDWHLEGLYDACIQVICNSEYYVLGEVL